VATDYKSRRRLKALANEILAKQFAEIEKKIERLLEKNQSLDAENVHLRERIDALEKELQRRSDLEKTFAEEKSIIRSKIEKLLSRLDDIEEPV
jgi:regulator of replication initiation timing